jgi:hypothetical protein
MGSRTEVQFPIREILSSLPPRPDHQWYPLSFVSIGYLDFPRSVTMTHHCHIMPRFRMRGALPPRLLYAVVSWCLGTGKTLLLFMLKLSFGYRLYLLKFFMVLFSHSSRIPEWYHQVGHHCLLPNPYILIL